jgi:hypothetical protein
MKNFKLYLTVLALSVWQGIGLVFEKLMFRTGALMYASTPNTIPSELIANLYTSLDVVSREMVGMIPAVMRDPTVDRAAIGQTVYSFVAPAVSATDIAPNVTPPDDGEQTITDVPVAITSAKRVPIRWQGEETRQMAAGHTAASIRAMQVQQAIRTLTNLIEAELCGQAVKFSRAYGTATTDPFASTLADTAGVRQILTDNGAPLSDMHLVISSSAGAKMRTLTQLTKANEANDSTMLRQGVLLDVHGFAIRESGGIIRPAVGTMSSATTTAAAKPVGTVTIPLATAGTGKAVAGDVITFAGDTNKYIVETVTQAGANPASGDTLTLAAPGLRQDLGSGAVAITQVAISSKNMGFARSAIVLATRLPALPDGGDMAVDRTTITDARSGMSFEIAMYAQYRQMQYEISCAWGSKVVKPEHTAVLLGA